MRTLSMILLAVAAIGMAANQPAVAQTKRDKISFRLDWSLTGYQLPFYWAAKKGYYKQAGLDVEIKQGAGSQKTINLVGAGHDDIGFADFSLMAASIAKGMAVKGIFAVIQDDAWVVFSHRNKLIEKPADLVGKSVVCVIDHKPLLDLLMKLNGIAPDKVEIRVVSPPVRNAVFVQGAADGVLTIGLSARQYFKGDPDGVLHFARYGVNLLGQGIIANKTFLQKNPDAIRRFIKATVRAFNEVSESKNTEEAVKIAIESSGSAQELEDQARDGWLQTIPRMHSENTRGKPTGWMSDVDWKATMKTLRETGRITGDVPLNQLYTNEFIPK